VGIRIRLAREAHGLTQADLARELDRSPASISLWESGERMPGIEDVIELGRTLDRPPDYFLPAGAEEGKPEEAVRAELILRAVATQLAGVDLDAEIERVLRRAARQPAPTGSFRPRSSDPIVAAQEVLSAAQETQPPIDVYAAASLCGARVIQHKFSSEALSGFVVRVDESAVIGTNARHHEHRQRFTIGHELGHLVLDHHADYHLDLGSSVSSGDPPGYDWRHERAANSFAANLLMPAGLVRADYLANQLSIGELADRYEVSPEAMGIRLSVLGLTEQ
jgi:Zn-dependent peptidase ImmA (M78 family)/transcriptional regulator with XRE-family HTH domain